MSAQSQNLYMVGGLEQVPKILVPVHSPGYGLVVGNHCFIQLTFHDFYMRFPTLPIFALSTGTATARLEVLSVVGISAGKC